MLLLIALIVLFLLCGGFGFVAHALWVLAVILLICAIIVGVRR